MKDGYYWIRVGGVWYVGKYETGKTVTLYGKTQEDSWDFPTDTMFTEDFDEIGDYIETPEKYKVK